MGVIFVAGVHAVGKTTLCKQAEQTKEIAHYSASDLIREEKANAVPEQGKVVTEVDAPQRHLIRAVHRVLPRHGGKILLDGHFSLLTATGKIEMISVDVFHALGLERVVVLHDEPVAIAARWSRRDGGAVDLAMVTTHQEEELRHARHVAQTLAIPLTEVRAFDTVAFMSSLA
ncbi:flagellar adenylate kinase [Burkholderiales bacterium GJ-E10]|nr:flagellar adenylate kinase [Burkholderiales bacterium GJ-E10]